MGRVLRREIRLFCNCKSVRLRNAYLGCTRMHRFTVNLGAQFVDNHYGKGAIPDPWIVTEPSRDIFAMLDCAAGCRKFQPSFVSIRYAALHIKIENSHHIPCSRGS